MFPDVLAVVLMVNQGTIPGVRLCSSYGSGTQDTCQSHIYPGSLPLLLSSQVPFVERTEHGFSVTVTAEPVPGFVWGPFA